MIPLQPPSHVVDRESKPGETGFLSAFTSYISSYAADDPPEPSHEELESPLCAIDCINQCSMGDIFARVTYGVSQCPPNPVFQANETTALFLFPN